MVNIIRNFSIILKKWKQTHLKLPPKKATQETAGAIGDLIWSKTADKIMKVSINLPKNSSEQIQMKQKILSMI